MPSLETGTVRFANAGKGPIGIELADSTYVLAEQLQAGVLAPGTQLQGDLRNFGEALLRDAASDAQWPVFVIAYDLSKEAVMLALR